MTDKCNDCALKFTYCAKLSILSLVFIASVKFSFILFILEGNSRLKDKDLATGALFGVSFAVLLGLPSKSNPTTDYSNKNKIKLFLKLLCFISN